MKRTAVLLSILLVFSLTMMACNLPFLAKATAVGEKTKSPTAVTGKTTSKTKTPTKESGQPAAETKASTEASAVDLGIGSTETSPKDGMTMVYVPEGKFLMGSVDGVGNANEHPQHSVIVDAFWIDQTEVTNTMFKKFVDDTSYQTGAEISGKSYAFLDNKWQQVKDADWLHPDGPDSTLDGKMDHPVVHVSWKDALAYCEWAGRSLPTEAQWEKAARGTKGATYPWGNGAPSGDLVNFADSSSHFSTSDSLINDGFEFIAPVGSYPKGASPYGALDIAGNVWEWTSSLSSAYPYSATDGREDLKPVSQRMLRGGSWFDTPGSLRSADRYAFDQTYTGLNTGFRCAMPIQ